MSVLTSEMVVLDAQAADKFDAIRQAGEILVRSGCVAPTYVNGMLAREGAISTYVGKGIAIPHGELADLRSVIRTGISVLQVPDGVEWDAGEYAYLVIGLASASFEHSEVLANLVDLLQAPDATEIIAELVHTKDPGLIVHKLTQKE